MAGKKKPTKQEQEPEIQEAEVIETQPQEDPVPDPKTLVEETPPGHPTLNELEHDPTAINRVNVNELSEEELAALARCGLRIEVSNPEDRAAAQRLFKTRNAIERVLTKLTGGQITMAGADNMDQKVLEEQIAALVAQRLAQGGQVQQQPAPQEEKEEAFFDTTAGTAVKYGVAMAGGAALLYGGQKLFGGDAEDVAALALNLADAW